MKKHLATVAAVLLLVMGLGTAANAQRGWVFMGQAHVDGASDHDNIKVTDSEGRFRAIQLRVNGGAIEFDRVVVHYGNGSSEVLPIRARIPSHGQTRVIDLPGERRVIHSVELWYSKDNWRKRPTVSLFGIR
jgi:hypothetical protein